jgi:hypothetical protein
MSDRAIAEEIGVHKNTVARARQSTGPCGPVDDDWVNARIDYIQEQRRIGRDGKRRRMPVRQADNDEEDEIDTATPLERRNAFLIFSNEAMLLARYEGRDYKG